MITAEQLYTAMNIGAFGHDPKSLVEFDKLFGGSKKVWQDGADYLNKLIELEGTRVGSRDLTVNQEGEIPIVGSSPTPPAIS